MLRLLCTLCILITCPDGVAGGESKVQRALQEAMTKLARYTSCSDCIAARGAWCLGEHERCVPDAEQMCGANTDPQQHVGVVGYGRCQDKEGFTVQAYFHVRVSLGHPPHLPPTPHSLPCSVLFASPIE